MTNTQSIFSNNSQSIQKKRSPRIAELEVPYIKMYLHKNFLVMLTKLMFSLKLTKPKKSEEASIYLDTQELEYKRYT
jgi:hypothetical protein